MKQEKKPGKGNVAVITKKEQNRETTTQRKKDGRDKGGEWVAGENWEKRKRRKKSRTSRQGKIKSGVIKRGKCELKNALASAQQGTGKEKRRGETSGRKNPTEKPKKQEEVSEQKTKLEGKQGGKERPTVIKTTRFLIYWDWTKLTKKNRGRWFLGAGSGKKFCERKNERKKGHREGEAKLQNQEIKNTWVFKSEPQTPR